MININWFDIRKIKPKEGVLYFVIPHTIDCDLSEIERDREIVIALWSEGEFSDSQFQYLWAQFFLPICDHYQSKKKQPR